MDTMRALDALDIQNLLAQSHWLVDSGGWERLATEVFADETEGVVPAADFGFVRWTGSSGIAAGFAATMPRFDTGVHAISNLHLDIAGDRATARYYVQGWHWVGRTPDDARDDARGDAVSPRPADFMVVGVMHDELVRQSKGWRIASRRLSRLGPDVAVGRLPAFLAGLGEG